LRQASQDPERVRVVDATRDCEAVAAEILDLVRTWLR